jgi:hypothetical protein
MVMLVMLVLLLVVLMRGAVSNACPHAVWWSSSTPTSGGRGTEA